MKRKKPSRSSKVRQQHSTKYEIVRKSETVNDKQVTNTEVGKSSPDGSKPAAASSSSSIPVQSRRRFPRVCGLSVTSSMETVAPTISSDEDCENIDEDAIQVHATLDTIIRILSAGERTLPAASDHQDTPNTAGVDLDVSWASETGDAELLKAVGINVLDMYTDGVVSVSYVAKQFWCEQQLLYSLMYPFVEDEQGNVVSVDDKVHLNEGTALHLARELEVHRIVPVQCLTREDGYAIRLTNMITSFMALGEAVKKKRKCVVREVPIFGHPFDLGIYYRGVIDEINYMPKQPLAIVEFKTRRSKTLPSASQSFTHKLQVLIYSKLVNDLVDGRADYEEYIRSFKIDPTIELSKHVLKECSSYGIDIESLFRKCVDLARLLPLVNRGWMEYKCQQDGGSIEQIDNKEEMIKSKEFDYNEKSLEEVLVKSSGFWTGMRSCHGVDIEDTWKCRMCDYASQCEWRLAKAKEIKISSRQVLN